MNKEEDNKKEADGLQGRMFLGLTENRPQYVNIDVTHACLEIKKKKILTIVYSIVNILVKIYAAMSACKEMHVIYGPFNMHFEPAVCSS